MNKIIGIVAEYNPFHNGHAWQIQKVKEQQPGAGVVAIMSGHFTQRGCPALLDKWARAAMAVEGGVDLVLELPFLSACKSAEYFARGAVQILDAANIITHLYFGAETNNIELLKKLALLSANPQFASLIKDALKSGISYAAATQKAMQELVREIPNDILQPNNILAIEYIKALFTINSSIKPVALPRKGAQHLDKDITGPLASATAIREQICTQGLDDWVMQTMPETSRQAVTRFYQERNLFCSYTVFEKLLLYRLRQLAPEQMRQLADLSEGLENRIHKAAHNSHNLLELLEQTQSRRYPQTRVMRSFCQLLILNKNKEYHSFKPYFRVLAFNNKGREIIKKIRCETVFPVITNLPDLYNQSDQLSIRHSLDADISATDTYQLLIGKNTAGLDFRKMPVYLDK